MCMLLDCAYNTKQGRIAYPHNANAASYPLIHYPRPLPTPPDEQRERPIYVSTVQAYAGGWGCSVLVLVLVLGPARIPALRDPSFKPLTYTCVWDLRMHRTPLNLQKHGACTAKSEDTAICHLPFRIPHSAPIFLSPLLPLSCFCLLFEVHELRWPLPERLPSGRMPQPRGPLPSRGSTSGLLFHGPPQQIYF